MESFIAFTFLKLEQCFLFIAFRISYSTNVMNCILRFWNFMGNMRKLLKIIMDFQKKITRKKKLKIASCIYRVRDSEHKKKETFCLQNFMTYKQFKNCSKIMFSLNNSFSIYQINNSKNKCVSTFCFTYIYHISMCGFNNKNKVSKCGSQFKVRSGPDFYYKRLMYYF